MKKKFKLKGNIGSSFISAGSYQFIDPEQRNLQFWVRFLRGEIELVTTSNELIDYVTKTISTENLSSEDAERTNEEEVDHRQEVLKWYESLPEQQKEYARDLRWVVSAEPPCCSEDFLRGTIIAL